MRLSIKLLPVLLAPMAAEAFVANPEANYRRSGLVNHNNNCIPTTTRLASSNDEALADNDCGCGPTTFAGNPSEAAKSMNSRKVMDKSPVYKLNGEKTTILQYGRRRTELLAAGVNLVIVSIGKPEVGKDLVKHLGIPDGEDLLFVDPSNEAYDNLDLNRGVGATFFNPATPLAFGRRVLAGKSMLSEELSEVLSKWKDAFYIPPKQEQAFYQGGTFLFSGDQTVYAHYDEATAAHAVPDEMIEMAVKTAGA
ncbi:unnamed protein product [Cylindrotheca closterium]|uniref:Uncharacterized protein n=1 Tax=Cylindrotheca closterium TaxID=2856 RepID=A0AAD2JMJ0_9STRA|nr:unnamed protein product [Cylindrotheca closterium]